MLIEAKIVQTERKIVSPEIYAIELRWLRLKKPAPVSRKSCFDRV